MRRDQRQSRRWGCLYKQSQFTGMDGNGRGPAEPSPGRTAPNKPNLPSRRSAGPETLPSVGAIAPNEANFRRGQGWARTGKVTQAGPGGAKGCQTKPIPPAR